MLDPQQCWRPVLIRAGPEVVTRSVFHMNTIRAVNVLSDEQNLLRAAGLGAAEQFTVADNEI